MKKLILTAFIAGGICTISAQAKPQTQTISGAATIRTNTPKGQTSTGTIIARENLKSDIETMNNSNLNNGNSTTNGNLNNNLGTMNSGAIHLGTPNGAQPNNTGVVDNKISSPGTVNIGTTGSLNTGGSVNLGATPPTTTSGSVINTTTPTTPVKKTR